jgi:hypothetical protein
VGVDLGPACAKDIRSGGIVPYPVPKVRCGERSGYPCNEIVALNSPHCGNQAHYPGANGGVPIARRPDPLTGDDERTDDWPDLDPVTLDVRRVHITQQALEQWGRHPAALQAKIRDALIRGGYWRSEDRTHLLELDRDQIVLSRDGRRCLSYARLCEAPSRLWGEPVDLAGTWSTEAVEIDQAAVRTFAGRHRVDDDTARRELSALLRDAATNGTRRKDADGCHRLSYQGFTVTVSPDGTAVTGYQTSHFERTPSQVRDNVPSRFGHARKRAGDGDVAPPAERDRAVNKPPKHKRVTIAEIPTVFDPGSAWITGAVVDHDLHSRVLVIDGLRVALRQAAKKGRWVAGTDGRHHLYHGNRRWIISADGKGVLSCKPPWPVGAQTGRTEERGTRSPSVRSQRPEQPCEFCGQPSGGPICLACDRDLRDPGRQATHGPSRLFSVRSVVYGGLPTLGKRRP